jgi:putative two-component system response regulator
MKTHTTLGAKTLQAVFDRHPHNEFIKLGIEISHFHHERWDGSGYPCGLSGSAIPLSARIMALADVYDALTSARCYKNAYSHENCREIILRKRGTHFDPAIVDAFLLLESKFHDIRQSMNDDYPSPTLHCLFEEADADCELELYNQIASCKASLMVTPEYQDVMSNRVDSEC